MNRKLTKQEMDWLIFGLEYSQTDEYLKRRKQTFKSAGKSTNIKSPDLKFYLEQIDKLRVVRKCKCADPDCHTIKFQNFERGKCAVIIDAQIEDGRLLMIDIHKETKFLAGLEVI